VALLKVQLCAHPLSIAPIDSDSSSPAPFTANALLLARMPMFCSSPTHHWVGFAPFLLAPDSRVHCLRCITLTRRWYNRHARPFSLIRMAEEQPLGPEIIPLVLLFAAVGVFLLSSGIAARRKAAAIGQVLAERGIDTDATVKSLQSSSVGPEGSSSQCRVTVEFIPRSSADGSLGAPTGAVSKEFIIGGSHFGKLSVGGPLRVRYDSSQPSRCRYYREDGSLAVIGPPLCLYVVFGLVFTAIGAGAGAGLAMGMADQSQAWALFGGCLAAYLVVCVPLPCFLYRRYSA
jgi:hypothetical protein